jgi:acyl carrier protein phosphodiesterase
MIQHNWLVNYQSINGLERILSQMDQRTKNQSLMRFATEELVAKKYAFGVLTFIQY